MLHPAARAAMAAAADRAWANPASVHGPGRAARGLLEGARDRIAAAIGAQAADVVLTGGGTEACNLAVLGLSPAPQRVITTAIEHPAVARAVDRLEAGGAHVTRLAVPAGVPPDPDLVSDLLAQGCQLFVCQWVNHETGTILPVANYAERCRAAGVVCAVDGTQALGKLPLDVAALGIDALALASHKLGGPAGAGALWVRRDVSFSSHGAGGGQERGRRPGSPDVLAQVGFGAACEVLPERLGAQARLARLQARLEAALIDLGGLPNGLAGPRVATVVNASFPGRRGDRLVAALDVEGVACASGAACSSGLPEPSPVLRAMYPEQAGRANSALRFSFGPETAENEVEMAIEKIAKVLARPAPAPG